jgi:hypothetical protein
MANNAINLAKRLRARIISLPITLASHTVFSKSLDITAAKQRAADWEPSVDFKDLNMKSKSQDNDDNEQEIVYMATYSAFDPGATHPLLLQSALPLSVTDLAGSASTASTARAASDVQPPSTTSSLHHAIEIQQADPTPTPVQEKVKPWPYSLPKALQPKVGTTFDMMCGDGLADGQVGRVKLGVLQKMLYGVPEPGMKDGDEDEQ